MLLYVNMFVAMEKNRILSEFETYFKSLFVIPHNAWHSVGKLLLLHFIHIHMLVVYMYGLTLGSKSIVKVISSWLVLVSRSALLCLLVTTAVNMYPNVLLFLMKFVVFCICPRVSSFIYAFKINHVLLTQHLKDVSQGDGSGNVRLGCIKSPLCPSVC